MRRGGPVDGPESEQAAGVDLVHGLDQTRGWAGLDGWGGV